MKYEIVKFSNGKFGLRRRSFIDRLFNLSGSFRDFKPTVFYSWRKPTQEFFQDCQQDDLKVVEFEYAKWTGRFISEVLE